MRIQAETLLATGRAELVAAALDLLEQCLREYPENLMLSPTLDAAGRCCETLGRVDDAVEYYRRTLLREADFPGIKTNACFQFARLAAEHQRADLYVEALSAVDAFGAPVFPAHAYYQQGIRAVVADATGRHQEARHHARAALDAASVRDTGLSHGRGHLGTVATPPKTFHDLLHRIADGH